ncbi:MAG: hypothetical protein CVV22_07130 [Ignavibacteriae bacterium HGW-Ignavibacteriae-1]|nr:MAG: hypothetical protein CVV22_07130 [Ignavibacteriae bacterium HGW-Ignavibacteriae-1]
MPNSFVQFINVIHSINLLEANFITFFIFKLTNTRYENYDKEYDFVRFFENFHSSDTENLPHSPKYLILQKYICS